MNKKNRQSFIFGSVFGLMAPIIGTFAGLQLTPNIGTILMFPIVVLSKIIDQPFGSFTPTLMIVSYLLSSICWGLIFMAFTNIISKTK